MAAFDEYREQLALLPLIEEAENRHLHILAWLTRFALECGCDRPVLVGCSAVELYTDACTATGDVDLIVGDINKLSANLLKIGFQRSSDPRYLYHLGRSILLEFPADCLTRKPRDPEKRIIMRQLGLPERYPEVQYPSPGNTPENIEKEDI